MSLDINKIVFESIQDSLDNEEITDDETINKDENINQDNEEIIDEDFDPMAASAISAGLGALILRNRLRSIDENIDWAAIAQKISASGHNLAGKAGQETHKLVGQAEKGANIAKETLYDLLRKNTKHVAKAAGTATKAAAKTVS